MSMSLINSLLGLIIVLPPLFIGDPFDCPKRPVVGKSAVKFPYGLFPLAYDDNIGSGFVDENTPASGEGPCPPII